MNIQPQITKPISDDQELAKALAGVTDEMNPELSFEELPTPEETQTHTQVTPQPEQHFEMPQPTTPVVEPVVAIETPVTPNAESLPDIKKEAITELRPLVEKLELAPEDKFDIYLLIIRSTDDTTLIGPAHAAARAISDETRRAQALLDIIKEIDYLSSQQKATQ